MSDLVPREDFDSWVDILGDVGTLARAIADTDFIPAGFRGKPAAIAAAVLSARELRLGPMTGLAHLFVVHGRVGMSAQLMRQLILSNGHELRYVETTETRCVVEGRRRGSEEWTRVSFTADQAKKAGVNLGQYSEDKLVARATSRLARRVFADCLGGVPYLAEELEDVDGGGAPVIAQEGGDPVAAPAPKRTVQRKPRPALPAAPPAVAEPELGDDEPPLDPPETPQEPPTGPETPKVAPGATIAQLRAIASFSGALGYTDRDDRLDLLSKIVRRHLTSGKDLTRAEASTLLDTLALIQAADDPQARLAQILQP